MAFTGVAVVTKVTDSVVRITGLSLAAAAAGTIGLFGGAGQVSLPDGFNPKPFSPPEGGVIDLEESIEISWVPLTANPAGVAPALRVAKVASPFLATITNDGAAATATNLEIWVRYRNA